MSAALPQAAASAASLPEPTPDPMLRERLRLLAQQSEGAVPAVLIAAALVAVVLIPAVPWPQVSLWIAAVLVPNTWRVVFSRRLLRGELAPTPAILRRYFGLALYNGVWSGSLPLLFFAVLPPDARFALTAVMLLGVAGGQSTFAAYRAGYLAYLCSVMPPLVVEWFIAGGEKAWIVVVALLVFSAVMARLSKQLSVIFERSVEIRFEREKVVEQLRQEKIETERARAQAEEASRAKSRFLANASHDLRQPAHALGLFIAVLEQTAETQQHREIARNIGAASRVLGELLDNLLDMSRLDAGNVLVCPQPVSLPALIERLRGEGARLASGRAIEVSGRADDQVVAIDPVLAERALRNLLDNALKFTARGSITLGAEQRGDRLAMFVEDTGCGIAAEQQQLVFEEFYQIGNPERDHRKGLGLGLSIVSRLAALMGGQVRVDSAPGRGACFTLLLPLSAADGAAVLPALEGNVDLRQVRALVIDDEVMVRTGMRELLVSWGAMVDEAEGLAQARERRGAHGAHPWRLCLCDLRLRDGEDGIETARALRAEHPRLAIVLITGDTAPHRIEQAMRSGLPLLHKPVSPARLAAAIRRSLAE